MAEKLSVTHTNPMLTVVLTHLLQLFTFCLRIVCGTPTQSCVWMYVLYAFLLRPCLLWPVLLLFIW